MKNMMKMLRMTIVGGALFMVPFVIIIIILNKALGFLSKLVLPIAEKLPFQSVLGLETPWIFAAFLLVLICIVAGLFAKTQRAKDLVRWLETALLSNLPGYSFMKNLGDEISGASPTERYQSVLVRLDDSIQVAFLVERITGGYAVVFIPGSPSPWSGDVLIVEEDRIILIDQGTTKAVKCLQKLGAGIGPLVEGKL